MLTFAQLFELAFRHGARFLAQHIDSALHRVDRHRNMEIVRGADMYNIRLFAREHVFKARICLCTALLCRRFGALGNAVRNADYPGVRYIADGSDVGAAYSAAAHDRYLHILPLFSFDYEP